MAGTTVEFNQQFFDTIMRSSGVQSLQRSVAERVLAQAKATAPVGEGDYRDGLRIEVRASRYRDAFLVVGNDWKTLILESKGGYLARALKSAGKG